MSTEDRTSPRVITFGVNQFNYEGALDYTDGYRVTVGWDEDGYWIARCSGLSCSDALGTGFSKELALLDLACSLAATVDAVNDTENTA